MTIITTQGKKRFSVLTLNLKNMTAVIPYTKSKNLKEEYGHLSSRMNFCADMFPAESYILLFETNGELSSVRIQCGEDFASELKLRASV